jgi:hypothetical protein
MNLKKVGGAMNTPENIVQFQVVTTPEGGRTMYALTGEGKIYVCNLGQGMNRSWRLLDES